MAQSILFISTKYTGHGHQSITESIHKQIALLCPEAKVNVIEGFDQGGNISKYLGHFYGPVTHYAKPLWSFYYQVCHRIPGFINRYIAMVLHRHQKLYKIIAEINPDLIVTVHPAFVGSTINLLEKYGLDIPVAAIVADIISINRLWADKRTAFTICPTEEAQERVIQYGVPENKAQVFGFPVREKFNDISAAINEQQLYTRHAHNYKNPKFLIVSGAEGAGDLAKTAAILLENFNCSVTVITGRNQKLRALLENTISTAYPENTRILGFVDNIEEYLIDSDILITRASPNTMMEAVTCCVPLIVTDALPGQEKNNPEFIVKHNLGIICRDLDYLPQKIKGLLNNEADQLLKIRLAQHRFRNLNTNKNIAQFLLDFPNIKYQPQQPNFKNPGL